MIRFVIPGVWPTLNEGLSLSRAAGWRSRDGKARGRQHRGAAAYDDQRRAFEGLCQRAIRGWQLPTAPITVAVCIVRPRTVVPDAAALVAKWAIDAMWGTHGDDRAGIVELRLAASRPGAAVWEFEGSAVVVTVWSAP